MRTRRRRVTLGPDVWEAAVVSVRYVRIRVRTAYGLMDEALQKRQMTATGSALTQLTEDEVNEDSQEEVIGAVVPVDDDGRVGEIGRADPWELLARDQGLLVQWQPLPKPLGTSWGPTLSAGSELAKQLVALATKAGAPAAIRNGAALFTLELPTGTTLQNLVPAVGGGFRGMVRSGSSAAIAGHGRLVPVGGAAAGIGAGIAMGPLVALMALSVGADMLGRYQQDKKLELIHKGVSALAKSADETTNAQLESAAQALELGGAAILDRVAIPASIGLGHARDNLRVINNRGLAWLDDWEKGIAGFKREWLTINLTDMSHVLEGPSAPASAFPKRVVTVYQALALDSRAHVLTAAEAALASPGEPLRHLQSNLQKSLRRNAESQERLREILWQLAERPVDTSWMATGNSEKEANLLSATLTQLATALSRQPNAPAILTASNRQVVEVERSEDGTLRVRQAQGRAA